MSYKQKQTNLLSVRQELKNMLLALDYLSIDEINRLSLSELNRIVEGLIY